MSYLPSHRGHMAKPKHRQLNTGGIKKPTTFEKALLSIIMIGLSICPLYILHGYTNDPIILCFVNWRDFLCTSYCFLKIGLGLLKEAGRRSQIRYSLWRIALCALFIVVSSYFLVAVLLDTAVLMSYNTFASNFPKRLENNIVSVSETRTNFMFQGNESAKGEHMMRYIGEDVRLVCEDTLYFDGRFKFLENQVFWKQNMHRIEPSSRHDIKVSIEKLPKTSTICAIENILKKDIRAYKVKTVLDIYVISEEDFGHFSCHVDKAITFECHCKEAPNSSENDGSHSKSSAEYKHVNVNDTRCPCQPFNNLVSMEVNSLPYDWNFEFHLTKLHQNRRTFSVPMGSILSSSMSYKTLDSEEVKFDHIINEQSFELRCAKLSQSCSIFVYLYWFLCHNTETCTNIPCSHVTSHQNIEGIGGNTKQCVCPYTYGEHKFVFYRQFYNSTLGLYQTIRIEHPDITELVPMEQNIFGPVDSLSNRVFQLGVTSCLGKFETTVCKYFEIILERIASNFFFLEKVCLVLGFVIFVVWSVIFVKLFFVLVTASCMPAILGRRGNANSQTTTRSQTLAGLANMSNTDLKYDLFISCDPQQNDLASDLAEFLQSRGLRVSHCDADVLGNEITTQGTSRLITESWKYLVIVTPDYVSSRLQNEFEMPLILQRFLDGYINKDNIALMPSDSYLIPNYFNICTIFSWPYKHKADVFERIRLWIGPSVFPSHSPLLTL